MKQKVLITGGAGYIGSHTVVAIKEAGYEPVIVDNFSNAERSVLKGLANILGQNITLYEGDCNDEVFLNKIFQKEPQLMGVIHFAAYKSVEESVKEPVKYYQNNVGSLLSLLNVMKRHDVRNLVFSSSCTVYGEPDQLPVAEEAALKPATSPYGHTKRIGEEIIKNQVLASLQSQNPYELKVAVLRYFNPTGAHPSVHIGELPLGKPNNLVPLITETAIGIRKNLIVYGGDYNTPDGTCIRDYIHVVDLAGAHVCALSFLEDMPPQSYFDVYNIGLGKGVSVLEMIHVFERISGQKLNYSIGKRRAGDVEKVFAAVDKAKKILNWSASLSVEQAIEDAWNWQKKLPKT